MSSRIRPLRPLTWLAAVTSVLSCASAGTRPADMTATGHQSAAATAEGEARRHAGQHDPAARPPYCAGYTEVPCTDWRSTTNPTEHHLDDAKRYRDVAARHRAASKILVEAEQRFCSGIPEADRDLSPFYHREDIVAVQGLKARPVAGYGYPSAGNIVVEIQQIEKEVVGPAGLRGARVTFRALPGMTGEWLQRVVDCHLARNAVVGKDPAMSFCPLAVPRATASVTSLGSGFAVDIASNDTDSVREIIKRVSTLGPSGSTLLK